MLLAPDMIGALAAVRLGHVAFRGGWPSERQAFWIALALAAAGTGVLSLDRAIFRRPRAVFS